MSERTPREVLLRRTATDLLELVVQAAEDRAREVAGELCSSIHVTAAPRGYEPETATHCPLDGEPYCTDRGRNPGGCGAPGRRACLDCCREVGRDPRLEAKPEPHIERGDN